MGRMILAVIAGFVAWTMIWLAANQIIRTVNPEAIAEDGRTVTSSGILVLLILVAAMACIVAGWLVAIVARDRGRRGAMILAGVLLVVGIAVQITFWDTSPLWYHLVFLGLLVPLTVAGGNLKHLPG